MPAWRLDENDRQVNKYDVGAVDGEETHFVGHVLLCDVDVPTNVNSKSASVQAVHMGPPLKQSPEAVDVVGTAELDADDLRRGERRQIKSFIDDRVLERSAQVERLAKLKRKLHPKSEYIIHPAASEPDAHYPLWRFNCAGFVLNAYLEANIQLVDQEHAPAVTLDFLKGAYRWARKRLDDPEFRKEMGIDIGDRWPVIMAGYVANSLNRSADEIRHTPYRPRSGDEFFPARDQDVEEETTSPSQPTH